MRRVRLTEGQLHNVIRESVNQILNELDWKTYASAARKKDDQMKNPDDYNQILSVNEYIDLILQKVTDENNSNLDDTAATVAMDTLLHEILNECKDEQSIEDRLKSATDDDKINWIISYEVKYIMEYSAELFQSHIFDKEGNPNKICNEIENWLHKEIDENLSKDLYRTDFNSPEGRERIDKLTSEILDIWKPE